MRRILLLLANLVVGTAVADADIIDVRDVGNAQNPDIFIVFDSAPDLVEARIDGQALELEIAANVGERRIVPSGNAWVSAIETGASGDRQIVRLELTEGASDLNVARTQTGLRLSWRPVEAGIYPDVPVESAPELADNAAAESDVPPSIVAEAAASEAESAPIVLAETASVSRPDSGEAECIAAATALDIDMWNIDALTTHAGCLVDEDRTADAIPLLERVIAFEPGRFDAVIALAEANERLGNVAQAQALYEQAAAVAATDGQAVAARARARRLENASEG
ncbi:tetratricopeptide repeat protein [Hyphobacterium sp.]|uniref:tetratricopeptide repeat protein n=1 Tax=Hyphobacterium sp. TaxID=2004662 RepID=UPI003BA8B0C8